MAGSILEQEDHLNPQSPSLQELDFEKGLEALSEQISWQKHLEALSRKTGHPELVEALDRLGFWRTGWDEVFRD